MKLLIVLLKEMLETLLRCSRLLGNKIRMKQKGGGISNILNALKQYGLFIETDFYTAEECSNLRNKIDNLIANDSSNVWVDEVGADHRIFFINEIDEEFNKFYNNRLIRKVLAGYTGTTKPNGMLLAARIDAKKGNVGSGGGWHRDSPITHQFKAICYLSDVNEKNGPFQYIRSSHKKMDVLKAYFAGIFTAGQYRFSEEVINNYLIKNDNTVTELTAREGTIAFADTKGLHRGKPIEEGSRYVLFCYFWHGDVPSHFERLRQ
ncbi:phytanoyl-CoA dioxygenase family protein [Colwellia sp. BRX9-1]|uniref:phytanoyl-CoA dioxygenase family protein n=1 Tax=Colwellia sp. BRX9-1 TaxID=2759830 RepID=UPI0015F49804|nr:phytanoyl-CoA dioxygenase family protein [Colwellia sp. BRX9-1]MBA6353598.1 phytanoyl-CoA dioxygenase family protein [Colwellia sp. BRX9-1]